MASINPSSPNSSAMPRGVWSRNCNPSSLDVSCGSFPAGNRVTCLAFATLMLPEHGETHIQSDLYFDGLMDFLQFTQLNLLWCRSSSWICHLQNLRRDGGGLEAWGGPVKKKNSPNPNIHHKHQGILHRNPAKMQGSKKYDHFLLGPWSSPTTCNRVERKRSAAPKSSHSSHIHWCF